MYTVHVELTGSVFDIGVDGKTTLTGPGGVAFTLHDSGAVESNPETGPIVKFMYSQYVAIYNYRKFIQCNLCRTLCVLHSECMLQMYLYSSVAQTLISQMIWRFFTPLCHDDRTLSISVV